MARMSLKELGTAFAAMLKGVVFAGVLFKLIGMIPVIGSMITSFVNGLPNQELFGAIGLALALPTIVAGTVGIVVWDNFVGPRVSKLMKR